MTKEDILKEWNLYCDNKKIGWLDIEKFIDFLLDKIIGDDEILNVNIESLSNVCLENLELKQKIDKLEGKIIQMDKERIKEI